MVQRALSIFRGQRKPIPPPVERMEWTQAEQMMVAERLSIMVIGGPERVAKGLQQIIDGTQADELIIVSDAFRHEDRLRSYEFVMKAKLDPRLRGDDEKARG
jgi:alkanesulfonate monooxygenase SsuD/methylene tetrahydromethanopterin reductase-like flavin-dependent oxidoreductase (luciferase family)